MSDDEGPAEESEDVVDQTKVSSNNINNTLDTKKQEQLFTRDLDKKQQKLMRIQKKQRESEKKIIKIKKISNDLIISKSNLFINLFETRLFFCSNRGSKKI